ncbi:unnamed protein product [Rotaria magnacalcarata]|uniref:Uncharacterized protein n=1 Tax=Rotaria magnacalcarata TaxID=392030 RepID=A0A819JQ43_9BILA|nr:unnamed protein product [Rotaria magnacalcarata]
MPGVNQRFTRLVHDSVFTNRLTLTKGVADGLFDRLDNQKRERFRLQILPSIRHKIEWLGVEASSLEDILLCTSYPNLYGLGLHGIEENTALRIFTDETPLTRLLPDKITSLVIDTFLSEGAFTKECLHFGSIDWDQPLFQIPPTISASTLLELHVILATFTDCLERDTDKYNELIVPLVSRMTNLEELNLHLVVYCEKRFIDGYDLKRNVISRLLQLNKFVFNIRSRLPLNDQAYLSSNEDCQHSFNEGQCHIYSSPYPAKYYEYITNNFPDGLFKYVREVSLYDERPFEHEFFIKIAKCFPFMEKLTVYNKKPQLNKFDERSTDDNRHLSVIQYPYLRLLDLFDAHDDYAEQFLLEFKTCLPIKVDLHVHFSTLSRVTHNFTRNATRMNCAKIIDAVVPCGKPSALKQLLKDYMPDLKIMFF